ncbi:MAG: TetR/AcrR family transcriptional regulator [Burkholderiaceae bacterium]
MRAPSPASKRAVPRTQPALRAPRPLKWERRKDYRPAELLEAARAMFAERGFAATRLDDVARAAGVSKGTLYLYYPSKEELFKAVVRSGVVDWLDSLRRRLADEAIASDALLTQFFAEFWQRFVGTRVSPILKLVIAESANFPEVTRFFHEEVVTPTVRSLVALIERGIARGEFRQVDAGAFASLWIAAPVLKAVWMHSFDPVCATPSPHSIEHLAALQLAAIHDMLRPDARPLAPHPLPRAKPSAKPIAAPTIAPAAAPPAAAGRGRRR